MTKILVIVFLILSSSYDIFAQDGVCVRPGIKHLVNSKFLNESREYWVSLPLNYSDSLTYPVIYVLDAEWRFDLTRHIVFDQGANRIIQNSILVGVPYVEVVKTRGRDLTFSESRNEYNDEAVDSTVYNSTNSGGGYLFYQYIIEELIPDVKTKYSTSQHETLIGHSYGGYFGAYILSLPHPFDVIHMYDPSIWYSQGEVIGRIRSNLNREDLPESIHITYQLKPLFHRSKIEELIRELEGVEGVQVSKRFYNNLSHNALYLDSFYEGIRITNK